MNCNTPVFQFGWKNGKNYGYVHPSFNNVELIKDLKDLGWIKVGVNSIRFASDSL